MPLWLYWILLGLIAGTLAKFLVPGRDPSGCIVTILLGIIGALIGGFLGTRMGWGTVTAGAFVPMCKSRQGWFRSWRRAMGGWWPRAECLR